MAELSIDDVTKTLKDVAYVAIGFGVLTAQRAQVQRREITRQAQEFTNGLPDQLTAQINEARENLERVTTDATSQLERLSDTFDDRIKLVEERLADLETRIDTVLDTVESRLPDQAADLIAGARDAARDARGQVRTLVGRVA